MVRTLCVGNLPSDSRVRDVESLFAQYGEVLFTRLVIKPETQSAYVSMDARDAKSALAALNGSEFEGQTIQVAWDNGKQRAIPAVLRGGTSGSSDIPASRKVPIDGDGDDEEDEDEDDGSPSDESEEEEDDL